MQLEVRVALAMVCLAGVVGAASLASLSPLDQYSPQHQSYPLEPREIPERSNWKDNGDDSGVDALVQSAYFRNGMIISNDPIATPEDHELEVDGLPQDNQRTLSTEEEDFVADDNFQDQGPGSVEVYKLDLARDKSLLNPPIPKKTFFRSKSKTPKKASFSETSWKPKNTPEAKVLNTKMVMEPLYEKFGIGGVPELQVGCEGLEASHRSRRSSQREGDQVTDEHHINPLLHVTPLSIELEYESEEDDNYEDELFKIKMIATTTKKPPNQSNRGDIEATLNTADLGGIRRRPEKLPNRGDLGKSTSVVLSQSVNSLNSRDTGTAQLQGAATRTEHSYYAPVSRQSDLSLAKDPSVHSGGSRKLLSFESDDVKDLLEEEYPKRVEREPLWGFGEDEGAITSEELESRKREREEDEYRKREYERRREEIALRNRENRRNHSPARQDARLDATSEIERIKQDYERMLQKEERRHRNKTARGHADPERRRGGDGMSEEKKRREEEERRAVVRRKWKKEERRRLEEMRRYEETKMQREMMIERRRLQEEERRRQEAERRNEAPSNLIRPTSAESEKERERKLQEYVRKNRPITVDARRHRGEARQDEEERKLQDYIRRMQPVNLSRTNSSRREQGYQERKRIADTRMYQPNYPTNGRSSHGPSAPTSVASQASLNEARRRQEARRLEQERRRIERQRLLQEEERREARRRYEEDRKRLEAARAQDERRRQDGILQEYRRANSGTSAEDTGRRREPSRAPANSILTRDRNIQELERRRLEAQRRNQELEIRRQDYESRAKEEARLNSLPVSARIIVRSSNGAQSDPPRISLRNNFENEIDFTGINPNRQGLEAARFPVPATIRPPVKSPSPCVWAILQCCPSNNRLTTCFESMGCPGVNWDPNPCRGPVAQAAHAEIMKFYESEDRH